MPTVLSDEQIEQFRALGHVRLEQGFPPSLASDALDAVWEAMPFDRYDRSTWRVAFHHVQQRFDGGPFSASWTDRVHRAFDDLLGEGRWQRRTDQGWWPITFPGFAAPPWQPPRGGFHVDGQQFHHHLDSPDQGLLPIFVWSEIGPGDGGTAIVEGSHEVTARVLAAHEPAGLSAHELSTLVNAEPLGRVVEAQGAPGDVILLHPFILHGSSPNCGDKVRFITNPCVSLNAPMDLVTPRSVVERSIAEKIV